MVYVFGCYNGFARRPVRDRFDAQIVRRAKKAGAKIRPEAQKKTNGFFVLNLD